MIIKNSDIKCVCGITSKFPIYDIPEIAFAGRSNVGKSSLINGLLNRKNLARTSSNPGKTVTINFYDVNNGEFLFVDLPGYGYAKASMETRAKWGKMIERYLNNRQNLKCVILLVDIRHKPTADDVQMFEWIVSNGYRPVVVATKLDKIKRSQLSKSIKLIRDTLVAGKDVDIIPFSSVTKAGREDILNVFDELLLIP